MWTRHPSGHLRKWLSTTVASSTGASCWEPHTHKGDNLPHTQKGDNLPCADKQLPVVAWWTVQLQMTLKLEKNPDVCR